jgi:hypothetical protein
MKCCQNVLKIDNLKINNMQDLIILLWIMVLSFLLVGMLIKK